MKKTFLIIFVILLFIFIGWQVFRMLTDSKPSSIFEWQDWLNIPQHKACTMEAKQCPDGSYVGRTGPNCEFTACPEETSCAKEGESIGAVYPGVVPKKCCDGLTLVIPQGVVGTQGICQKIDNATADWKTYRNEEYGFEIKYPNEWHQARAQEGNSNAIIDKNLENMFYTSADKVNFYNIQDWFRNEFKDRANEEKPIYSNLTIASFPAIHYVDPISIGGCLENYVFIKNSVLYNFQRGPATCIYSEDFFNQILSTFKFIK